MFLQHVYVTLGHRKMTQDTGLFPSRFDFDSPEDCARGIAEKLSAATGGRVLKNCRVTFHPNRQTASVLCGGAVAHYHTRKPTRDTHEALHTLLGQKEIKLGTVCASKNRTQWSV